MKRTVLIVDDEPQLLRLLVRVFLREDFEVLSARDGTTAIKLFEERGDEIDVLVLDVIIPPGGAKDVLEVILPQKPDLGLILASGNEIEDELHDLMSSHAGIFLRKPFLPKELIARVNELMKTKAEQDR